MAKKPNGRFLLTWNEKKHPDVTAFFSETKEGMYSHTIREAISFYMQHKDDKDVEVQKDKDTKAIAENTDNHDYDNFNPNDL